MTATREDVIREFPELDGDPNEVGLDPDNPSTTKGQLIQSWIDYWNELGRIIRARGSK